MSVVEANGRYHASVIFDFDLTLFPEESTLRLVRRAVAGNARLTSFIANYASRDQSVVGRIGSFLNYMSVVSKINKGNLQECIDLARLKIEPVFSRLMHDLREAGVKPYVISSGYFELISPLLNEMGIPDEDIAANRFLWVGGRALTVMPSPLHGSSGKVKIVEQWRSSGKIKGPFIMVGDALPDRKVFLHGLADGFIQADYYTQAVDYGLMGNYTIARTPGALKEQLFMLLNNIPLSANASSAA